MTTKLSLRHGTFITFIPNPLLDGQLRIVSASGSMKVAEEILAIAKQLCPVSPNDDPDGHIIDTLRTEKGVLGVAYVKVGTHHWIYPEFGSWNYPPEPYLRPALDQVQL